ncbi:tetratricopeptide repeat protein [Kitasatospora sp. YST-16]|uniref:tetratricopeptide repeat protein n=1 Tax=Kitasatospora sp. YST-16 TaxID=2998080 RepID=UPI0022851B70|nr:tetratricopeptide repeat protein [Kitasatospora sp. YST-16]WAL74542.1 tetratricopeptide repeat protein [Kitasatospora sp. YST-16]WNW40600.1 tetratricopeptide repeat protein [Streptomyces sp. Li-HN-5-13]
MGRGTASRREVRLLHPLAVVRYEHHWTHQDVADIVARATNGSADRRKVWKWEHWGTEPDAESQAALATELDVPLGEVSRLGWPGWLPDGGPIHADFPWSTAGVLKALDDTLERAMPDRRGFMKLGGQALVLLAGQWLAEGVGPVAAALAGGRIDLPLVEELEAGLPRLRRMEAALGGPRARHLLHAELEMVTGILKEASYSDRVGQRMLLLSAELARLAGWSSFDAGLHTSAQRYWTSGLRAAHAAGDRALGANIIKSLSLQCYDHGLFADSLALAAAAVDGAGEVTPRTLAMLLLRQARAAAACHNRAECDRLLATAETQMARADTGHDDPAWTGYFDPAEFHAQTATCHADLGRPQLAQHHYATALALMPAAKHRDLATYTVQNARTHTALGDADHAIHLLEAAIPMITAAPSQRNAARAAAARAELPLPTRHPKVQRLDQLLATLSA